MNSDTIAAVSTAMSPAGIGIVRISGAEAFDIADQIYDSGTKKKKKLSEQPPTRSITALSWMERRSSMRCW